MYAANEAKGKKLQNLPYRIAGYHQQEFIENGLRVSNTRAQNTPMALNYSLSYHNVSVFVEYRIAESFLSVSEPHVLSRFKSFTSRSKMSGLLGYTSIKSHI